MRLTKARREIKKIFEINEIPLNADQVYNKLDKEYDLSTIYRNLDFFQKENFLKSIVFSDKIKYFYEDIGHFHYIYCVYCKKFEKFDMCYEKNISEYIEKNLEFEIISHTLYFEGICKECRNKGEKNE
jgi:Fur family ferric uptake transcriptional regulator